VGRKRERESEGGKERMGEEQLVLVARGPVLTDIFAGHSASVYYVKGEYVSLDRKEFICPSKQEIASWPGLLLRRRSGLVMSRME